jgi:crotonobetainyl-CoA:carnitine CoA-transferase CaiB-like acyl-CoA transferase
VLSHWKVLDLTDRRGELAGFVLAELGAEVVKLVPDPTIGVVDPDGAYGAYHANKSVVHLDPATADGRAGLEQLLAGADVVLDSGPPGVLASLGLGRAELDALNPLLVTVVVTPFGLDGPRADQPCSELTLAALGGPLRLQGTPARPPVQISVPQVWRHAGAEAALAAMVAHARMVRTGQSQFVDVSAQSAMTWTMLNAMEAAAISGRDFERTGSVLKLAVDLAICHPAADGYVVAVPRAESAERLLPWLLEEGIVGPEWLEEDWSTFDHRSISGEPTVVTVDDVTRAVAALCSRHPRSVLLERGLELGTTLAPVNAVDDLLGFGQLDDRAFWTGAEVDATPVRVPGVAFRLDGRRPEARRRYGRAEPDPVPRWERRSTAEPPAAGPAGSGPAPDDSLPFSGLKVADFSWIGVGPITSKCLADHGATVVRVESQHRIDGLRVQPPMKDGVFGINRSNFYGAFNTSKLGLALDLKTAAGRSVAKRLAAWADVVIDSFTPGVMERLGLGPADIRAVNPSVVTVNTSLLGHDGRYSSMAGYGYHAAALAGFFGAVGWPDLPPDGPWLAYTDTIGPRLITPVLLAALDHRRRTGEGTHIEVAQLELALQFQAPEVIACQLGGAVPTRTGNRDPRFAPQGVYPCKGADEWCAVTVTDDEAWARLVEVLGRPDWAVPAFATSAGRRAAHDEIDAALGRWTVRHDAAEVEALLCRAGIPAGRVLRSSDLLADPQFAHRRFYAYLEHAEVGVIPYAGHQYRIAGYDHGPRSAAPCLGEHTVEVLTDLLGLDVDELAEVAAAGALE